MAWLAANADSGVHPDTPHQDPSSAQAIGEIAAEQTEGAANQRGDVEQQANPVVERGIARRERPERGQRGAQHEREHQHFIQVERETQRRHSADQPLDGPQARGRS